MLRLNKDGSIPSRQPFLQLDDAATTGRSGRSACAIPSRSRSTRPARSCSSTTWARTPGRKSTTASPAPTTAGPRRRGRRRDPTVRTPRYAYNHSGGRVRDHRRRVLLSADGSVSRPTTRTTTSSRTIAPAGFGSSIPPQATPSSTFATGISSPVDLKVADDGALYYLARGTGSTTGVVYRIDYGADRAEHHHAPRRPDRPAGRVGHVQREGVRYAAAAVSVAAQRRQHRRSDREDYTLVGRPVGQRRAVPGRRQQRLRQRAPATKRC